MRSFHQRVAIVSPGGDHIRYVPGSVANAMVNSGSASIRSSPPGKVKSVTLAKPAASYAERVGDASQSAIPGVRFYRWVRLDESASRIIEHHPRALDPPTGDPP